MRPQPQSLPEWSALAEHRSDLSGVSLRDLFGKDTARAEALTCVRSGLVLDLSKNLLTSQTVSLLCDLARAAGVPQRIEQMFSGEAIDVTENRPVLHVALRAAPDDVVEVGGKNVVPAVHDVLRRMGEFAQQVRGGGWTGTTGQRITDVVNIGIGGSDLGPAMAYQALKAYSSPELRLHFVSNVDGADLDEALQGLAAEQTLFIVSSKTFTTAETLTNARSARSWLLDRLGSEADVASHFVAVSTKTAEATSFGIAPTTSSSSGTGSVAGTP